MALLNFEANAAEAFAQCGPPPSCQRYQVCAEQSFEHTHCYFALTFDLLLSSTPPFPWGEIPASRAARVSDTDTREQQLFCRRTSGRFNLLESLRGHAGAALSARLCLNRPAPLEDWRYWSECFLMRTCGRPLCEDARPSICWLSNGDELDSAEVP